MREGDVPQNIHLREFWSKTFCKVGGSVSSAIGLNTVDLDVSNVLLRDKSAVDDRQSGK